MVASSRYSSSKAPKRKPPKRRISIDQEAIPACSTSQTEVSAASLSASAHKIKNNLAQNNTEMARECYLL